MYAKIIALLAVIFGTFGRVKYLIQGNKIRRRASSVDISGGFYILTTIGYTLMLLHCINIFDWVGIIFWSFGLLTSTYCLIMCYLYWDVNFKEFLKIGLKEIFVDTINTFKSFKKEKIIPKINFEVVTLDIVPKDVILLVSKLTKEEAMNLKTPQQIAEMLLKKSKVVKLNIGEGD